MARLLDKFLEPILLFIILSAIALSMVYATSHDDQDEKKISNVEMGR